MKLLKRNTTTFEYLPYLGKRERTEDGKHTGEYPPTYGVPVPYTGMINASSGLAQAQMYGFTTDYTHVLLMDDPKADIKEQGRILWNGDTYEIRAVRPTINVLSVALRKLSLVKG